MLLIALTLLTAQPQAEPAASPELDCIVDAVPAARRHAFGEAVAGRGGNVDALRQPIVASADACATRFGWTADHKAAFGTLATATIIGEHMERRLRTVGIDPEHVAAWFERQPAAIRTNNEPTDAVTEDLLAHLRRSGVAESVLDANGTDIGVYLGTLILIVRIGEGLPA